MPLRTRMLASILGVLALLELLVALPSPVRAPGPSGAPQAAPRIAAEERPRAKREPRREVRTTGGGRLVAVTDDDGAGVRTRVERPGANRANGLRALYPKQFAAEQIDGSPATFHWALIIGINDYASTRDNYGSRQDAIALKEHLRSLGWRSDHIMLLTDRRATARRIVQAIRWLDSRSDERSTVVFHYAGHEKPLRTSRDGDDEKRDVAIWAADNGLIIDGDLGRELGKVEAHKMWIHMATCRARGFDDRGMSKPGRLITFSSEESEYSYEDPELRHSVFGWQAIVRGMRDEMADSDDDGRVTVEEAYRYARPRTVRYTDGQQHPSMVDRSDGSFSLRVPPKPRPDGDGGDAGDDDCTTILLCGV